MSALEQSASGAELEKVYKNFIEALSCAMVDQEKVQDLKDFFLDEVALYGWFGEVQRSKNSRAAVMVSQCISNNFSIQVP